MGHNRAGDRRKARLKRRRREERRLLSGTSEVGHGLRLRGIWPADEALLARVIAGRWSHGPDGTVRSRHRDGAIQIEWVDENHPRWEEWNERGFWTNAEIDPISGNYLFRRDARHIEVLEEFLHNTQKRLGILAWPYPRFEIHVKDFMIRHRRLLNISDCDVDTLRRMLPRQVKDSKVDTENVPLAMPASASRLAE